jgi:hypothetical protein
VEEILYSETKDGIFPEKSAWPGPGNRLHWWGYDRTSPR